MNAAHPVPIVSLVSTSFDPWRALSDLSAGVLGTGAVASFVGVCRPTSQEAAPVTSLLLDHYPGFTEAKIAERALQDMQRFGLLACLVIHRTGHVAAGEPIVAIGCAASHRAAAFDACEALMDWLKTDAPFWKQEVGPEGKSWITPTAFDHMRRQRHP
jgi:molybdopterin synthase catalytic subunit